MRTTLGPQRPPASPIRARARWRIFPARSAARLADAKTNGTSGRTGGDLGIEADLFKAADKLRGNMEPSDYKHVALGLIFLKHISDGFEAKHAALLAEYPEGAEDPDEYAAENVFWVPKEARWSHLKATAKQPGIGKRIDEAMLAIEKVNPSLKGVLPKEYARPALDAVMLGELIDLISGIALGATQDQARDLLGRVYEYFLGQFAGSEGKRGGESYNGSNRASATSYVSWYHPETSKALGRKLPPRFLSLHRPKGRGRPGGRLRPGRPPQSGRADRPLLDTTCANR